jgi:hypothetical protein
MNNLLLLGGRDDVVPPESVDLDGTNDFFSRASDLTGNADGKTFTFSAWFYNSGTGLQPIYAANPSDSNTGFGIFVSSDVLFIRGHNTSDTEILNLQGIDIPLKTFVHMLVSVDLTDTGKRHIYINDAQKTPTVVTYTDDTINFTNTTHSVGELVAVTRDGRLAQVFLDYTFRDLTIAANRRLFTTIDSERGLIPAADQASLSPILYLAMDDPTTAFVNLGTGGDFTLNGTIARSGRGPNQYNSSASDLDGSADFLTRGAGLTGATDTKLLTCAFSLKSDAAGIDHIYSTANTRIEVTFTATRTVRFVGKNSAGTTILDVSGPAIPLDSVRTVSASFDLANAANRFIFYGSVSQSLTVTTYTDDTIDFTDTDHSVGATTAGATKFNGDLSDFYLGNEFIDLASGNPFFNSVTGKPRYLGESGELPTGSSPLIYLPFCADDAGNNLGTGGDFTVTSGPFLGARGPSEFWARSAEFDGSTGSLSKATSLDNAADGKAFAMAFGINNDTLTGTDRVFTIGTSGDVIRFSVYTSGTTLTIDGFNSGGTQILSVTVATAFTTTTWSTCLICVDLANASNREIIIDNVITTPTWTTYTDDLIDFSETKSAIGASTAGTDFTDGELGFLWFNDAYIDFTSEANRLLFVDAFNLPVDQGDKGLDKAGVQPVVYMKFEDSSNLGLNSGTGGNFTVNGTIVAGSDVKG